MKANLDKCHLITSCDDERNIYVNNYNKTSSKCEKLSGKKTDHKLNFIAHIDKI